MRYENRITERMQYLAHDENYTNYEEDLQDAEHRFDSIRDTKEYAIARQMATQFASLRDESIYMVEFYQNNLAIDIYSNDIQIIALSRLIREEKYFLHMEGMDMSSPSASLEEEIDFYEHILDDIDASVSQSFADTYARTHDVKDFHDDIMAQKIYQNDCHVATLKNLQEMR